MRLTWIAGLAGLLAIPLLLFAAACAAPAPATPDPEAVVDIMRALGLERAEAERQVLIEQALQQAVLLAQTDQTNFAGAWWEGEGAGRRLNVVVVEGRDGATLLMRLLPAGAPVELHTGHYSTAELRPIADQITALLTGRPLYFNIGVDPRWNRVTVGLATADEALADELTLRFGDAVVVYVEGH